jgi:hypothetical protein
MSVDVFNRWLTLAANIGVLVGLLLLAFELNQNREMMRAQTRNDIATGVMQLLTMPAANPQLAEVIHRGDAGEWLSAAEELQYRRYFISTFRYYENVHYQFRQGLYDEEEFQRQKLSWRSYAARSKGSIAIWCEMRDSFSVKFVQEMDANVIASSRCGKPRQ